MPTHNPFPEELRDRAIKAADQLPADEAAELMKQVHIAEIKHAQAADGMEKEEKEIDALFNDAEHTSNTLVRSNEENAIEQDDPQLHSLEEEMDAS